jgi:hypothetical protein
MPSDPPRRCTQNCTHRGPIADAGFSGFTQVHHNLESQRLQYAMQDRLQQLGWREVEVVDDDLGRSA